MFTCDFFGNLLSSFTNIKLAEIFFWKKFRFFDFVFTVLYKLFFMVPISSAVPTTFHYLNTAVRAILDDWEPSSTFANLISRINISYLHLWLVIRRGSILLYRCLSDCVFTLVSPLSTSENSSSLSSSNSETASESVQLLSSSSSSASLLNKRKKKRGRTNTFQGEKFDKLKLNS